MTTITKSRIINIPANQVWETISNYNNVHVFHPFVERADQLSEVDRGIGATRQCNLYNSSAIVEEVTEWEEGRSFTVVTSDQPIFGETTGTMRVDPIDANRSNVTLDTNYTPKWGLFGKALDILVLRMGVTYTLNRVLKSLQYHMETGELVSKGGKFIPLNMQSAGSEG